jgi:hypothetical protein
MAQVKDVIKWLSERDPEEVIALTGWWYQSDVENNNDTTLTEDEWWNIVDKHEDNTEIHIDEIVQIILEERE